MLSIQRKIVWHELGPSAVLVGLKFAPSVPNDDRIAGLLCSASSSAAEQQARMHVVRERDNEHQTIGPTGDCHHSERYCDRG